MTGSPADVLAVLLPGPEARSERARGGRRAAWEGAGKGGARGGGMAHPAGGNPSLGP